MSCHISVRDVQFTPSDKGVRIVVITDVPCHLWCRLTSQEPWVHKKATFKRGVFWKEDVRFCFTVYEDNEQYEDGDTLTHTYWKDDWPPCTTKWVYFWGSIAAEVCSSDTPFFVYHNSGEAPVPTPDIMDVFNSIEPQLLSYTGTEAWLTYDCSHFINPDSNGVILHIINKDASTARLFGLKTLGQAFGEYGSFRPKSHQWAVVGVDSAKKFQALAAHLDYFDIWAVGYTGKQVKFLAEPYEITPTVNDTWEVVDLHLQCPNALGAILWGPGRGYGAWNFDARKNGSTDEHYLPCRFATPFVGLDTTQACQVKGQRFATSEQRLYVLAYITAGIYAYTNVQQLPNWGIGSWHENKIDYQTPAPKWGILKVTCPSSDTLFGARKKNSLRDLTYNNNSRLYVYVHCDPSFKIEYYRGLATQLQYLLAEVA